MTLADLQPSDLYSVIKSLPHGETIFATGAEIVAHWEESQNIQRFSAFASFRRPQSYEEITCSPKQYILVRAIEKKETLRTLGKVINVDPIILCLLSQ
jgi:hypothetical protein